MSDNLSTKSSQFRWVFHGNLIVPTGNPFSKNDSNDDNKADDSSVHWLGTGLQLLVHHVLVVDHDGIIVQLEHEDSFDLMPYQHSEAKSRYVRLSKHEFLCPGFVDLHIHAPQYAYTGTATDRPLMGPEGWLETYTFPAERSLKANLERAQGVYQSVVRTTLQAGTTTAVYFATLHLEPCQVLVDVSLKQGQRALVGKVCMDRNSPDDYCQTLQENVEETKALIDYIRTRAGKEGVGRVLPLVLPIVTPRFVPTCSPALMQALGEISARYDCHIQSHISESVDEVEFSRQLDANEDLRDGVGRTDAEIFDVHGLLSDKCIMAHGVHLSNGDLNLLKANGSAVAHCPLSNFYFAGNSLPCRRLMERGNKVGLGTDVAGGYSPSMLNSARMAVVASHSLQHHATEASNGSNLLDYRHAFYLATLGGAEALGLQDRIGTFRKGMEFDAILLSANVKSPIQVFETDTVEDAFQKICTLGDDRNVKRVYVQGREVVNDPSS